MMTDSGIRARVKALKARLDDLFRPGCVKELTVGGPWPALRDYRKELWSSAFVALLPSVADGDFNGDVSAVVRVLSAIDAGVLAAGTRFTFHDLRAYYATQHKVERGELPDLHKNRDATARVYDRNKTVRRSAL